MPRISVVIITKNEERNIERCLISVTEIADEIIVLDSFSSDQTQAICSRYPVTFIQRDWAGYSPTKNYANSLAQGDYILSLDADEALSPELITELAALKPNLNGVYEVARRMNYCGKWITHGGWYPDRKKRLFPKEHARWDDQEVHEDLVLDKGVDVHKLKGDLLHYSYYTVAEHIERGIRYTDLAARQLMNKSSTSLLVKSLFSPFTRVIRDYIFRAGFLDGTYGLLIALITGREVYWKYSKALKLKHSSGV
ncbi:MAG: glycosyltransferase family 2 protein [Gammaproteobacteria bacterium]|nr:glycosyltransferase family 2 protein [Gammaproteobacteria bacterium]